MTHSPEHKGSPWIEFGITLLTLVCILLFFRFASDDYSAFDFGAAAKQFSDYPYCDYYFLGLIGLADIYYRLYSVSDACNWMGISWVLFSFASLYMALRTLRALAPPYVSRGLLTLCQIGFAFLFIENLSFVSHTRFSLVFCGLGLVNLLFRHRLSRLETVGYSSVFVFGMLVRPESAVGMLLLVGGGYLLFRFRPWHAAKRLWLPVTATALLFVTIAYDISESDWFVKKMEPEIEYKFMDRRVVDISDMKTTQDSLKYRMAVSGLWFDPHVVTPEFMRTLLVPGPNLSPEHAGAVFAHLMQPYRYYFALWGLQLVLAILCLIQQGRRKTGLQIVLLVLFTFLLLYALDYNGLLVSGRHFLGIQAVSLLMAVLFYFDDAAAPPKKWSLFPRVLLWVVLLAMGWSTWKAYRETNAWTIQVTADMEKAMVKIEERYSGRIVVVTNDSRYWFDRQFSIKNHVYTGNTYLLFDHGAYNLVPHYMEYLKRVTGCDVMDPVSFFRWLSDHDALYMADPARYDLTRDYMQAVHGQTLEFASPVNINRLAGIDQFTTREYEIRSIKVVE